MSTLFYHNGTSIAKAIGNFSHRAISNCIQTLRHKIMPRLFHLCATPIAKAKYWQFYSCGLYYKSFTIVIYNRNDNGLYYKTTIVANLTTIVANLALARRINYECKVRCKLKRTFMIVDYDPKSFILQATGARSNRI